MKLVPVVSPTAVPRHWNSKCDWKPPPGVDVTVVTVTHCPVPVTTSPFSSGNTGQAKLVNSIGGRVTVVVARAGLGRARYSATASPASIHRLFLPRFGAGRWVRTTVAAEETAAFRCVTSRKH